MKIIGALLLFVGITTGVLAQGLAIRGGHSHNDYHHEHPLYDALSSKMVSIEADVFSIKGELLVGHTLEELTAERTLKNLYIAPLYALYEANRLDTIILMIDIKREGELVYQELKPLFERYKEIFSVFYPDSIQQGLVTVILSGDRPWSLLSEEKRYAALDGRFDRITFSLGYTYFPMVSTDWAKHLSWDGSGEISEQQQLKLVEMVEKCHQQNKLIRFWNTASSGESAIRFWKLLHEQKVDLIGADHPKDFQQFIR